MLGYVMFYLALTFASSLTPFLQKHIICLRDPNQDCFFMILSHPAKISIATILPQLQNLIQIFSGSVEVAEIDSTNPLYQEVCHLMNLQSNNISLSYYVSGFQPIKIKYDKPMTLESLTVYASDMVNDRIRTLRSEDEPLVQNQVIKLVGSSFNHFIAEGDKQIVVLFYHHEQPRSMFMLPRFESLGFRMRKNKNIVFATFNMALNQLVQNEGLDHLPNILFFHRGSISPKYFEGPNRIEKVEEFLRQTTDYQWIIPEDEQSEQAIEQYR